MTSTAGPIVRVTRQFKATPERVFDAWLDAKSARRWLFATTAGEMVRAEIDPRVGGHYVFVDRRDGDDVEHTGEYLEMDRPRRLVFTFGVPAAGPAFDVVTVDIVPAGSGCELTLTQQMGAEFAEYADRTAQGWGNILDRLQAALA